MYSSICNYKLLTMKRKYEPFAVSVYMFHNACQICAGSIEKGIKTFNVETQGYELEENIWYSTTIFD